MEAQGQEQDATLEWPYFPLIVPLVPMLLLGACIFMLRTDVKSVSESVERQEALLGQIAAGDFDSG